MVYVSRFLSIDRMLINRGNQEGKNFQNKNTLFLTELSCSYFVFTQMKKKLFFIKFIDNAPFDTFSVKFGQFFESLRVLQEI